jgi:cell division septum initiation protein DivIVA
MAPGEGADKRQPARRGRGKRVGGGELIEQLNEMVAELIKENRKLKRQVERLTARGSEAASSAVERSLRTIQRRVERALAGPAKGRRRKAAGATTRSRKPATRRRPKP